MTTVRRGILNLCGFVILLVLTTMISACQITPFGHVAGCMHIPACKTSSVCLEAKIVDANTALASAQASYELATSTKWAAKQEFIRVQEAHDRASANFLAAHEVLVSFGASPDQFQEEAKRNQLLADCKIDPLTPPAEKDRREKLAAAIGSYSLHEANERSLKTQLENASGNLKQSVALITLSLGEIERKQFRVNDQEYWYYRHIRQQRRPAVTGLGPIRMQPIRIGRL